MNKNNSYQIQKKQNPQIPMPGFKRLLGKRQLSVKTLTAYKPINNFQVSFKKIPWPDQINDDP